MSQPTSPAPKKTGRSPVEAAIVWGVIGIGVVLVGVEARAYFAHGAAFGKLQKQVAANSETNVVITKKDVDKIVGNKTAERQKLNSLDTGISAECVDIYDYSGFLKARKIYVYYGVASKILSKTAGKPDEIQEAEVLSVLDSKAETADQAFAKLPKPDPSAASSVVPMPNGNMVGGGGAAGPGAPPAAGGRPPTESADDKKPGEDAKPEATAGEKKSDEKPEEGTKPAAEKKPEGDAKPAETEKPAAGAKPAEPKAEADKPAAEKPAVAEPKKE